MPTHLKGVIVMDVELVLPCSEAETTKYLNANNFGVLLYHSLESWKNVEIRANGETIKLKAP